SPNPKNSLKLTYNGEETTATYIGEQVLGFEINRRQGQLFFMAPGRAAQAVFTLDGENAVYNRGF
ncbi:MAG TPA: hypothetical protein VJZ27_07015, partial [Aggregatilineales bacterium]|nr:hypothetical protein [Aggregatilineales bacterium]